MVLQDNFLFDGTIAANIAYARPHASREEIKAVSRIAHCDEFIEEFEKGYDTIVGERGVRLSGGQRQRVAIARAILADPKILILDEATSSLDSESEAMIQDALKALRAGRTTFVIAHRLSTIRSSDQIMVLEHGEIVERGTHEELLARDGRYRQLYDKQYRFEKDRFINPGEDFTPEPEKVAAARVSNARESSSAIARRHDAPCALSAQVPALRAGGAAELAARRAALAARTRRRSTAVAASARMRGRQIGWREARRTSALRARAERCCASASERSPSSHPVYLPSPAAGSETRLCRSWADDRASRDQLAAPRLSPDARRSDASRAHSLPLLRGAPRIVDVRPPGSIVPRAGRPLIGEASAARSPGIAWRY